MKAKTLGTLIIEYFQSNHNSLSSREEIKKYIEAERKSQITNKSLYDAFYALKKKKILFKNIETSKYQLTKSFYSGELQAKENSDNNLLDEHNDENLINPVLDEPEYDEKLQKEILIENVVSDSNAEDNNSIEENNTSVKEDSIQNDTINVNQDSSIDTNTQDIEQETKIKPKKNDSKSKSLRILITEYFLSNNNFPSYHKEIKKYIETERKSQIADKSLYEIFYTLKKKKILFKNVGIGKYQLTESAYLNALSSEKNNKNLLDEKDISKDIPDINEYQNDDYINVIKKILRVLRVAKRYCIEILNVDFTESCCNPNFGSIDKTFEELENIVEHMETLEEYINNTFELDKLLK